MGRSLSMHGEIPAPVAPPRLAFARKGFRPFFLVAAIFAAAMVPLWLLSLFGVVRLPTYLDGVSWHAHEMLFGYAVAVIAGFLLTAVSNWTQRETATGGPLLALATLWSLGRVVMTAPLPLPRGLAAIIDLAFLPVLAVVLARPIVLAKNRRNLVMIGVLVALFAANLVVHLDALSVVRKGSGRIAYLAALDVVVFLGLVITGRVLPMFTRNATGKTEITSARGRGVATLAGMLLLVALDVTAHDSRAASATAGLVGALALVRAARWGTRHTGRHPLLWVLHAGYAWLGVGLLLRAAPLASLPVASSVATHALTAGALGALTLGMMVRVGLGHTGRALVAGRTVTVAFALVSAAAIARVAGPLVHPAAYLSVLIVSGVLWSAAFTLYAAAHASVLTSPRVDGKPG